MSNIKSLIPQKNEVNLLHIESRSSKRTDGAYEFIVECDSENCGDLPNALEEIKGIAKYFNVISREYKDNAGGLHFFSKMHIAKERRH